MKRLLSKFNRRNVIILLSNEYVFLGLIFLFFFTYFLQVELMPGDDIYIYRIGIDIPLKNAFTMTARLTSNILGVFLAKFNLIFWKIGTPIILTLLVYSLSSIIIGGKVISSKSKIKIYLFVFLTILFIYPLVLTASVFWVSGSVSYIWPISIGIYSFLHFTKFYNKEKISFLNVTIFFISSFYAAFGQEQISALLTSFSIIFIIYYFLENRKFVNKFLIFQTIIYLSGSLFLLSPFSNTRLQNDIYLYYPDFLSLASYDKIYRGLIWLCNQLFNKEKLLVFIFLFLLLKYNLKFNENKIRKDLISILLSFPIIVLVLNCIPIDSALDIFLQDISPFHKISFDTLIHKLIVFDVRKYILTTFFEKIKLIFWIFYLFLIPILPLFISKEKSFNYKLFIILLAAFLSSSIMFFAPSIYESNHRVFLTMDILIVLSIGILFNKINIYLSDLKRLFVLYSIYPLMIYLSIQLLWHSGYYVLF